LRTSIVLLLALLTASRGLHAQLRGVPAEHVDPKLSACTDFDAYANGAWRATHAMPASENSWALRTLTRDRTTERLRSIAQQDADQARLLPRNSPARLTGDFYAACMDVPRLNAQGLRPLQSELGPIERLRTVTEIVTEMIHLQAIDIAAPLVIAPRQDIHNTQRTIADVVVGGLGMPDRDYYLRAEPRFKTTRDQYELYIHRLFVLAGAPAADAARGVMAVMRIETALAQARLSRVEQRDPSSTDHLMTIAQLQALSPHVDWQHVFTALGVPAAGLLNVSQPALLQVFDSLLDVASIADWRAYLRWTVLNSTATYLAEPFDQQHFSFYDRALTGVTEQRPRWQRCVVATDQLLGEALGHEYVDRYLPPEARRRAREMAVNIIAELKQSIETRDWMSASTKARALEKINAIDIKIGYPDRWKDYAGVLIDRRNYLASMLSARRFEVRDSLGQIGKPVDRGRWHMTPPTMNAYYSPTMNEIVVPAGYLQPPGFDAGGLDAINYGAVGVSIGHEISHAVDDEGAKYAADGRLENWWTDADYRKFETRTQCTTRQYGDYEVEPGLRLNGKLVTGEALGDLGGVNLAYRAYMRSRATQGPEAVVDGFSPAQQFFLAEAQWRGAIDRPERARVQVTIDPHPPGRFRVLGPLSNMPEFQQAFQCKAGEPMVRPESERCALW
jgi:putative endopeptidase